MKVTISGHSFTKHGLERAAERGITTQDIEHTLRRGVTEPNGPGKVKKYSTQATLVIAYRTKEIISVWGPSKQWAR